MSGELLKLSPVDTCIQVHTESIVLIYQVGSSIFEYLTENKEYKGVGRGVLLSTPRNLEKEIYQIQAHSQVKVHIRSQKATMTALKETFIFYSHITEISKTQPKH